MTLGQVYDKLFDLVGEEVYSDLIKRWNEPHRFYHTQAHLDKMLESAGLYDFEDDDFNDLLIATLFHDAVYFPWKSDNEEQSVELFKKLMPDLQSKSRISSAILATKSHKNEDHLSALLNHHDMSILHSTNWNELLTYENQIFQEYQYADLSDYVLNRSKFLLGASVSEDNPLLVTLSEYVKTRKYRIAVFPGSFNPYHIGHEEVRLKAERLFDKVILAIGVNPSKGADQEKNFTTLKETFPQFQVVKYETLLSDFVKSLGYPVTIVRGLRNGEDFGYEQRSLRFLQEFNPDVEIIYIPSSSQTEHISSSAIREISKFDLNAAKKYLL